MWNVWASLTPRQWWDDREVAVAAAKSAVIVDRKWRQLERSARAYALVALRVSGAAPTRQLEAPQHLFPRNGVSPMEVYARPAKEYRWTFAREQARPDADRLARRAARDRLHRIVEADARVVQDRVQRDTYRQASNSVTAYRRVIHPELSETGVCGLCVAASTRVYTLSEMKPIHNNCKCQTMPILAGQDRGWELNEADLATLYGLAGGTTSGYSSDSKGERRKRTGRVYNPEGARGLKAVRFKVAEHSELGKILADEQARVRDWREAGRGRWREPDKRNQVSVTQRQQELYESLMSDGKARLSKGLVMLGKQIDRMAMDAKRIS